MKIIKLFLFSLLAFSLIVCTGIFILFQTFDTDQYFPQIKKKLSFYLGRPVSLGSLSLGLSSVGITLDAGPLRVADDPLFTTQPFITVDKARISVNLKSLILRHEIHITRILLDSPQIHIIRNQEGLYNFRSIGQSSFLTQVTTSVNEKEKSGGLTSASNIKVNSFTIQDGRILTIRVKDAAVSYIDQNTVIPLDIWLRNINASLINLSLSKPIRITFNACFYSEDSNVHGSTLVDYSKGAISFSDLSIHTDFSRLDMDQIKGISPHLQDKPFFKRISGDVQLNFSNFQTEVSGDLKAKGHIIITDGLIKDFNIVKTGLSQAFQNIGGFGFNINNLIDEIFKDKLSVNDTVIKTAKAQFLIHAKTFTLEDSLIETNVLEFKAQGSLDQSLNLDMQTTLHLNSDISLGLINKIEGLRLLCDDSKRITIEAALNGTYPHLKYKPNKDFRKKSKRMLIQEGANILGLFLGGGK